MPSLLEIMRIQSLFWSNELNEPIHVHVSKGKPSKNSTKIWLTKNGKCILASNPSRISNQDLSRLFEIIELNYFRIIAKWKETQQTDEIKFYC